jgi:hypothetical protein
VSAIIEAIPAPHVGQAVITRPPQSGHTDGTVSAFGAMNLRPQPQVRQNPHRSPSSRLRSYPTGRFLHTAPALPDGAARPGPAAIG